MEAYDNEDIFEDENMPHGDQMGVNSLTSFPSFGVKNNKGESRRKTLQAKEAMEKGSQNIFMTLSLVQVESNASQLNEKKVKECIDSTSKEVNEVTSPLQKKKPLSQGDKNNSRRKWEKVAHDVGGEDQEGGSICMG